MNPLPYDLFRHILSFRGPIYELARRYGTPSAEWAQEYTSMAPCAEYRMINDRIVILYWGRPYMSVHRWDLDWTLPTRASF